VSVAIGLFISANSSSFHVATSLATPILTITMMFSGFLVIVDDIPDYFKMFQYISHFYYGMELAMVAIYRNTSAPCDPADEKMHDDMKTAFKQRKQLKIAVKKQPALAGQLAAVEKGITDSLTQACHNITTPQPDAECGNFARGKDLLDHFEYHESNILRNMLCLLGITLGFHLMAFIILTLKMWRKSK